MTYVEMRHTGISHDLKCNMEIIPRIGETVSFKDTGELHQFKVMRVIHCYEDGKLNKVYLHGQEIDSWDS